ncbi:18172_t:CDS:2, partial [Entrophospora sp. SA101]
LVASSTARRIPIAFSKKNSFSKEAFSGTLAGCAQVVVGFPFDTIKVRLQTDSQKYKTAINCLKMTIRQETALGLYKGSSSPMLGNGISNAILFSTNKKFRGMFNDGDSTRSLTLNEIAKAGALTGVVMSFVNCPVELLKVKLQTQYDQPAANKKYTSVFHAASSIYNQNNIKGLYRGITATVIRDVPIVYEGAKKLISDRNHRGDLNKLTHLELLMAGGTAGIACWIPCYPQDVIKTHIQREPSYTSTLHCIRTLIRGAINSNKSILRVFTKGFAPTMARAFPANAATFFAYEKSKELFREK